jgi:hypothetical protein
MALKLFPVTALDRAYRIAVEVKALVDRPRQAAMVKGLKRYLLPVRSIAMQEDAECNHHAATSTPPHLISFRNAVYNLPDIAWFESDMVTKALALTRSIRA